MLVGKKIIFSMEKPTMKKVEALDIAISRLALLYSHDALCTHEYTVLIVHCTVHCTLYSVHCTVYTVHCTLCTHICCTHPAVIRYDKILKEGLMSIPNVDLNNNQWTQATLLVKLGGFGFPSAVALVPPAFMASAAGTRTLQNAILPLAYRNQLIKQSIHLYKFDSVCPR